MKTSQLAMVVAALLAIGIGKELNAEESCHSSYLIDLDINGLCPAGTTHECIYNPESMDLGFNPCPEGTTFSSSWHAAYRCTSKEYSNEDDLKKDVLFYTECLPGFKSDTWALELFPLSTKVVMYCNLPNYDTEKEEICGDPLYYKSALLLQSSLSSSMWCCQPSGATDLAITVLDSADPVSVGQMFSYFVHVKNLGPVTANFVSITNTLSSGLSFIGVAGGGEEATCNKEVTGNVIYCRIGSIAPSDTVSLSLDVKAVAVGFQSNTAVVKTQTEETDLTNNKDAETTRSH